MAEGEIEDVAPKEVDIVEEETHEEEHVDNRIAELEERIRELEAKLDGITTTVVAEPEPERSPNPSHPWFRRIGK